MTSDNSTPSQPRILVTGATGTIGKQVAASLLDAGIPVRLASRRPEALAELAARGPAETVHIDLEDPETLAEAFSGIERVFLLAPFVPGFSTHVRASLAAAREAGVRHVVRYSAMGASSEAFFALAREHGLADEATRASGLDWTILQPTFYQDNLVNFQGEAIRGTDAFYGASGAGKAAYVSSRDVAAVAAAVLREPSPHRGKTYLLTGPQALADAEVAVELSCARGKETRYVDVGPEGVAQSLRERGTPEWFVESMVGLERVKREGWAAQTSSDIRTVLGREPEPLRVYLERNAAALA